MDTWGAPLWSARVGRSHGHSLSPALTVAAHPRTPAPGVCSAAAPSHPVEGGESRDVASRTEQCQGEVASWLPVAGTAAAAGEHAPPVLDPLTLNPSLWRGYVPPYIMLDYPVSKQTNTRHEALPQHAPL